ncbi:MAG: DNA gyrase inhibitor YacG [Deltaproteobacteria bacterium RIFCSPLOWO2_02_FULL_44_10]|nr:MAG: DNA gyrase inhibitor YacG [Deltaproteobacteria bacterium RIFCSPHIGHO2_02_FULL_44_16]OGQ46728.1 MAG: DNA gyrase inhibitor YacG [Deltaproteobacteria bacterium RIFCSPLOWO2_02_FULL_44_10]
MKKLTKIKCPYCGGATVWEENLYRPFCSERCKLLDLGKWASDEYRIEGEKTSDPKDTEDDDQ